MSLYLKKNAYDKKKNYYFSSKQKGNTLTRKMIFFIKKYIFLSLIQVIIFFL